MSEVADRRKVKSAGSARPSRQANSPSQTLLFAREDWSLYVSLSTLSQRAGVSRDDLPWLICKEFADNALDAADAAGRPGAVQISVDACGNLIVDDQGTGITGATPEKIADIFRVSRPMLSSKLLRQADRGAVGNGIRVCAGYLTTTGGRLIIEAGGLRVELQPEMDGTSRIIRNGTIKPRQGLRLIATAGTRPFCDDHLAWARDAIELARRSGRPAFDGRTSPHWHDLDHFRVLLGSAVGGVSVRAFLAQFDGCTGSAKQTQIAAPFLRRAAASLNADEAATLLANAQAATKPPKPKALCPLGPGAIVSSGYAIEYGVFTEGANTPLASIPFIAEAWAFADGKSDSPPTVTLFMNRTTTIATCTIGGPWRRRLTVNIDDVMVHATVPVGPRYDIAVAITAPMYRLNSDGKAPDVSPFRHQIAAAVSKAAKQAGRDIASLMASCERRLSAQLDEIERHDRRQQQLADRAERQAELARIAAEKAERKARPSVRDVVFKMLPDAARVEGVSGLPFGPRRIVYRIRDTVQQLTGIKELEQGYFDRLLTEWEFNNGALHPNLIREARGAYYVPHVRLERPLGTLTVREFRRPPWTFNKILLVEKEDLRLMLQMSGWCERNDCLVMSCKGFTTRAGRDLLDLIAQTTEPVRIYHVHDGDGPGSRIHESTQFATLARAARVAEIIDLGLHPWEGIRLGLPTETVPKTYKKDGTPRRVAVAKYVRDRTDKAPTGETWEQWLQHTRIELNAFASAEFIAWLDRKLGEHGDGKLIPPDDLLVDQLGEALRPRASAAIYEIIQQRRDDEIADVEFAASQGDEGHRRRDRPHYCRPTKTKG